MASPHASLDDVYAAITRLRLAIFPTTLHEGVTRSELRNNKWDGTIFVDKGLPASILGPILHDYFSQIDHDELPDYQSGGYISRIFETSILAQARVEAVDGERSLQAELHSSLFAAVRETIWAQKARNEAVGGNRVWQVRSDSGDKQGRMDFFFTLDQTVKAKFELKRREALSDDALSSLSEVLTTDNITIKNAKIVWADSPLTRFIPAPTKVMLGHVLYQVSRDPFVSILSHANAYSKQVLAQFESDLGVRFVTLSNGSLFMFFERAVSGQINVYDIVNANGRVTAATPVGKAYMLLVGISVFPYADYPEIPLSSASSTPAATVQNPAHPRQGPLTRSRGMGPIPDRNGPDQAGGSGAGRRGGERTGHRRGLAAPVHEGDHPDVPSIPSYTTKRPAALELAPSHHPGSSQLKVSPHCLTNLRYMVICC